MKITKSQLRRIIKEEIAKESRDGRKLPSQVVKKPAPHGYDRAGFPRESPATTALLDLDDYDNLRESMNEFAKEFAHNLGYDREDIIEAMKSVVEEL